MSRLGVVLGIGGGLLIFSGLGLMTITHGVFMHQLWFKIKLALIIMLVLNGFLVGNREVKKLRKETEESHTNTHEFIGPAISRLNIFYLAQLGIFLIIIMLAVFKFN
jgi:uncharacterized membrane protein SirB2